MKSWIWLKKQLGKSDMNTAKLIVAVGLAALLTWLYVSNLKKEAQILSLGNQISELSNTNSVLNSRIETYKKLFVAGKDAAKEQSEGILEQDKIEKETTTELKKLPTTGVENVESRRTDAIPDAVIRLLNNHCERVRGSPCDNP